TEMTEKQSSENPDDITEIYKKRRQQLIDSEAAALPAMIIPLIIAMTLSGTLTFFSNLNPGALTNFYIKEEDGNGFITGLRNASIFLAIMIAATVMLCILIKYNCFKCITVYLVVAIALAGTMSSSILISIVFKRLNWPLDLVTFYYFSTNSGFIMAVSMLWFSHPYITNGSKIALSVIAAVSLTLLLPKNTTYILLVLMSIWDMVAVLPEKGPLKLIVKYALKNEKGMKILGALVYNGNEGEAVPDLSNKIEPNTEKTNENEKKKDENVAQDVDKLLAQIVRMIENRKLAKDKKDGNTNSPANIEEDQVKKEPVSKGMLGLGDFVFYSFLVASEVSQTQSFSVAVILGFIIIS
ncbi:MAG: Presenilin-1, partial [Paramarteilia canceri]